MWNLQSTFLVNVVRLLVTLTRDRPKLAIKKTPLLKKEKTTAIVYNSIISSQISWHHDDNNEREWVT